MKDVIIKVKSGLEGNATQLVLKRFACKATSAIMSTDKRYIRLALAVWMHSMLKVLGCSVIG